MTGSDAEKRWGEDWEITSGQTWTCVPSGKLSRGLGLPKAPLVKSGEWQKKFEKHCGSWRRRELRDCWAESFCLNGKITEQSTKLKLYVAFVKLNLAITEAARL